MKMVCGEFLVLIDKLVLHSFNRGCLGAESSHMVYFLKTWELACRVIPPIIFPNDVELARP